MLHFKQGELLSVEDLFENDELVLTKAIYQRNALKNELISVGFKDKDGDIFQYVDIRSKAL